MLLIELSKSISNYLQTQGFADAPILVEEYREVINLLNKGYAIRDVAKLTGKGISTVQRVKKEFVA